VNFLFDENLPVVLARALHELGEPVRHVVDVPEPGKGATDPEIIPYAADWD
jgi:predicted nuclease of predicted toxin-antitoxin system